MRRWVWCDGLVTATKQGLCCPWCDRVVVGEQSGLVEWIEAEEDEDGC